MKTLKKFGVLALVLMIGGFAIPVFAQESGVGEAGCPPGSIEVVKGICQTTIYDPVAPGGSGVGGDESSGVVKTPVWGVEKQPCANGGYEVEKGICMVEFSTPVAPVGSGSGEEKKAPDPVPMFYIGGAGQGTQSDFGVKVVPNGAVEIKSAASGQVNSFESNKDFQTIIKVFSSEAMGFGGSAGGQVDLKIFKDAKNDTATFGVGSVDATLEVPLEVKEGKVFSDNKEVKILPDRASKIAVEKLGDIFGSISLKDVPAGDKSSGLAYELNGLSDEKLFGFIKVKVPTDVQIDAVSGELIGSKKPWWSFLSF
jgi:hypothetical protein